MEDYRFYETLQELHEGCPDRDALRLEKGFTIEEFKHVERSFESLLYAESKEMLKSIVNNTKISLAEYIVEKLWFDAGPEAYSILREENALLYEEIAKLRENDIRVREKDAKYVAELDKAYSETRFTLCFTIGYAVIVTTFLFLTRRAGY